MPRQRSLVMTITIFWLFVIIAGCGGTGSPGTHPAATPSPTVRPTPTPTPIPMVRVTIQLVDVYCNQKQNALGFHDQFYMMTTFVAPGLAPHALLNTQAQLSLPLDITSQQDLSLPQSHLLVFDGLVPLQGLIRGGFTAYNDAKGLTWGDIDVWVADIARRVGNQLLKKSIDSDNIGLIAAAAVLDLGVNAWYVIANLTNGSSHQLGKQDLVVEASGLPSEDGVLHFYNSGGLLGFGRWDYTVRYHITRSLVTG